MGDNWDKGADDIECGPQDAAEGRTIELLRDAAQEYLDYLHSDEPLGADAFKFIKGRIVTLACKLRAELEPRKPMSHYGAAQRRLMEGIENSLAPPVVIDDVARELFIEGYMAGVDFGLQLQLPRPEGRVRTAALEAWTRRGTR